MPEAAGIREAQSTPGGEELLRRSKTTREQVIDEQSRNPSTVQITLYRLSRHCDRAAASNHAGHQPPRRLRPAGRRKHPGAETGQRIQDPQNQCDSVCGGEWNPVQRRGSRNQPYVRLEENPIFLPAGAVKRHTGSGWGLCAARIKEKENAIEKSPNY